MTRRDEGRLVYSSQHGRVCPHCGQAQKHCRCRTNPRQTEAPRGDGTVRVGRESKGRRGKTVSIVTGVPLDDDALRDLAGELKRLCGSGGAVKQGVIEIQGDHRDALVAALEARGYRVKRAGG